MIVLEITAIVVITRVIIVATGMWLECLIVACPV